MKNIKKCLNRIVVSAVLFTSQQVLAAPTTTFVFNQFTTDSREQCIAMKVAERAKSIQITVDLSLIQSPYSGLPSLVSTTGIFLTPTPTFRFMGLKDKYAYMSKATNATINDQLFYDVIVSFVSQHHYDAYQSTLRLNDANGNACMVVLKQV